MLGAMSDPQQPPVPPYPSAPQPPASGGHPPYGVPQQQPTQPYSAQPQGYAPTGYPAQPGYPAAGASGTGNPPGRIGFIVGLIGLALGLVFSIASQAMIRTGSYEAIGLVGGLGNILSLLAAVAALILGIVGLRRPGAPHGQAGIAVGLGIAGTVSGIFGVLIGALTSLLYAF
jgi:hypothetical protein